jgi:hypothetical protein
MKVFLTGSDDYISSHTCVELFRSRSRSFVSWFIKATGINKLESNRCDDNLCEDIWFWQDINPNGYDK